MPPPNPPNAWLPLMVLLVSLSMPKPELLLPLMVLFVTVSTPLISKPSLKMPPPPRLPKALLSLMVLFVTVTAPRLLKMPPPPLPPKALLPLMVQLVTVSVPLLKMPPPEGVQKQASGVCPLVIVSPEMVTVTPELMVKMRNSGVPARLLRSTVSRFGPGPVIVRFLFITSVAVVNVIGLVTVFPNVIVLPSQASIIACLRDPAPLSPLLVTTGSTTAPAQRCCNQAPWPVVTALTADGRPGIRATVANAVTIAKRELSRLFVRDPRAECVFWLR